MFNLKAGNHQVIGTSQSYKDARSCENCVESIKKNAPGAPVVDVK